MPKSKDSKKVEDSSAEDDEYSHLTYRDYKEELEQREFSMFWDSLDIVNSKKALIILFCIRLAFIMSQVHLKKHPDEIQQGKEIAYQILNGQSTDNMNGV